MMRALRHVLLLAMFPVAVLAPCAMGQEEPPPAAASPETPPASDLRARQDAIRADTDLDEAVRAAALALYDEALAQMAAAAESATRAADFARLALDAPARLDVIRAELERPAAAAAVEAPPDAPLSQLEQSLAQATADLEAARRQSDELQAEQARRSDRRAAVNDQLARLRAGLAEIDDALTASPAAGDPPVVAEARRALLGARRAAVTQEIAALEQEAASYDARRELLPARRDRALRQVDEAAGRAKAWQDIVSRARQQETQRAAQEAARLRREAADKAPALHDFAADNEKLVAARAGVDGLDARITASERRLAEVRQKAGELDAHFRETRERMDNVGLTRAMGLRLRREFDATPEPVNLHREARLVADELSDLEYNRELLDDEHRGAGLIEDRTGDLLALVGRQTAGADSAELEAAARELVIARRDLLDRLVAVTERRTRQLDELGHELGELAAASAAYRQFIEERILWVRSVTGSTLPGPAETLDAVAWLINPASWQAVGRDLLAEAQRRPAPVALGALLLAVLIAAGRAARRQVQATAQLVASFRTDRYMLTLRAFALTLVAAAPLPAVVFAVAWSLKRSGEPVAQAVAAGLMGVLTLLVAGEALRQALRPDGLTEAHFRWPEQPIRAVRRHLRWFLPVALPPLALARALDAQDQNILNESLGRLALAVALIALAVFSQRVLHPGGPALRGFFSRNRGGWLDRLRYIWYPALVGLPLALLVASLAGYHYTALRLEARLDTTLALTLTLAFVNGLLQRWLFVARRRLAVEDARRRREQAPEPAAGAEPAPPIEEEKLDLPAISAQTRQLFRSALTISLLLGLWLTWADVLPALRILDRVQLYPEVAVLPAASEAPGLPQQPAPASAADAAAPAGSAAPIPGLPPSGAGAETGLPASVTLADIGLALVLAVLTYVLVRNLPALVEIVLLQRLPLDAGSRYAIGAVLRYAVAIIGIAAALSAAGISWNKVQWLAAALTFGLAFGLQEIFANFISGLIMLAERPVRVGDTVTVGNVSGTVTRIRMRATTISDWDRKELIIPNKTFITDQVINWTLSDPILRLVVPVGVAYGTDPDKVEALLLKVARANRLVLDDPRPQALCIGFGDSALSFELRVFIGSIEHLVQVRHQLHGAITREFQKARVEIAFPQIDLHLRDAKALADLIWSRSEDEAPAPAADHAASSPAAKPEPKPMPAASTPGEIR